MNKKIRTLIKLGVLCIGVSVILNNCEKSNILEEEVLNDPQKEITQDFVMTITSFSAEDNTLKKLRHNYNIDNYVRSIQSEGNTQSKTSTDKSIIVIDTSVVKKITRGDYTSYTMRIASIDDDPSTFYNITIEVFGDSTSMFVTQFKNFDIDKTAKGSSTSKTNAIQSSTSTKRIDDLTKPIGPEDLGNEEGGGSSGGSGGGGGSSSFYPTDCEGIVVTTLIVKSVPCGCGHEVWDSSHNDVTGCRTSLPQHPYWEETTTYECIPISNIDDPGGSTGGSTGGGGTPTNGGGDDPETSLITPVGDDECLVRFDSTGLSDAQIISIKNYIKDNGCSQNSVEFLNLAIEALKNGGEVDFEDKIINELKGKEKCAYDLLKETNGNLFNETIGLFGLSGEKYDLKITYGSCSGSGGEACTDPSDLDNNILTIKIADTSLSVLEQALNILHEGIHAEIYRYVNENGGNVDLNDRINLYNWYMNYQVQSGSIENTTIAQHQHMADRYIYPLARAMRELDGKRFDLEKYLPFAWSGLSAYGKDGYYNDDLEFVFFDLEDIERKIKEIVDSTTVGDDCDL